jgi:tetratricopeptide (TPR) repeat protein
LRERVNPDFFISYTSRDVAWAEWIAWQLESVGRRVVVQAWDFRPGSDFVHKMDQAVRDADRLIIVLSPAYVQSEFAEAEWRPFFTRDRSGERGTIVQVRVGDIAPSGVLESRVYVDLFDITDAAAAREILLKGIEFESARPTQQPAFPPAVGQTHRRSEPRIPSVQPRICNTPHRNPQFIGRQEMLASLHVAMTQPSPGGVQTHVLYGSPGIGKSQLALEYAHRYAPDFDLVWWIEAETAAAIPPAFARLDHELRPRDGGRVDPRADEQIVIENVFDDLSRRDRWLLILDHAQSLATVAPYLPARGAGRILITSRNPNWHERVASPLKVDVFPPEDAVAFLLRRTGSSDRASATTLAAELGNLPLALEQAAAYMSRSSKSVADYLSLFDRRRDQLLARGEPIGYSGTVDTTVQLAVEQLHDAAARALLTWCAFMAADSIPVNLLTAPRALDLLPEEMRPLAKGEIDLDDAIAVLYGSSLLARRDGVLDVHRLVQTVLRAHLARSEYGAWAELTVRLLFDAFPSALDDLAAPSNWPRCEQLLPHIYAAAARAEDAHVATAMTAELLMHLGSYLQYRGEYAEAASLFERALGLMEGDRAGNSLAAAHVLNALGYVRRAGGDVSGARAAHERALRIMHATLPPDHEEVGRTLNTYGRVLYEQKDLTGARANFDRALAIIEASAPGQPEEASILNNIARIHYDRGELRAARTAHERALAIKESSPMFGPQHPSVADTLAGLGRVLAAQHDFEAAKRALERARTIQEDVLGDHPDLVTTLNALAAVLEAIGQVEEAKSVGERVEELSAALLARPPRRRLLVD